MKKEILTFPLLLLFSLFTLFSCEKEVTDCNKQNYADMDVAGAIHNEYMANLEQFDPEIYPNTTEMSEKVTLLNSFHKNYTSNVQAADVDDVLVNSELDKFSAYTDHDYLFYQLYNNPDFLNGGSVFDAFNSMLTANQIDQFEYNLLKDIYAKVKEQKFGASVDGFRSFLQAKQSQWDAQAYDECSAHGKISALILSIGLHSVDYWIPYFAANNTRTDNNGSPRVAPWVAADVGGALIGATVAAIGGADDRGIGVSIIAGAVVGSTGLAGRIGKWLFG